MYEFLILVGVVIAVFLYRICKSAWLGAVAAATEYEQDRREIEQFLADERQKRRSKQPMHDVTPAKGAIDLPSDQYRVVDQ
ncbi:MAG: hypothetical protein MI741_14495 [Rhodospirillales bacterium]|nr:hypothetical protein [Rhodospirillales bacterium]